MLSYKQLQSTTALGQKAYLAAQFIWHNTIVQCMQNHHWYFNAFNAAMQFSFQQLYHTVYTKSKI